MRTAEHLRMAEFEEHYWWFVGRRIILASLLDQHLPSHGTPERPRRILDVGCGSGGVMRMLQRYGQTVGLDPAAPPLGIAQRRGQRLLVQGDGLRLPFADESFDLVSALDVIEHMADDSAALAGIHRVLAPGGHLLVTVPAYEFLWSQHDVALSHYRRYTSTQVQTRLLQAGFKVERLTYAISALLPAVIGVRLLDRIRRRPEQEAQSGLIELPPWLNRLCLATLEAEAAVLRCCNLPVGVSVVALAQK